MNRRTRAVVAVLCVVPGGCVLHHRFEFPTRTVDPRSELGGGPRWAIGEVFARTEGTLPNIDPWGDWSEARTQIEHDLDRVLRRQRSLATRVERGQDADVVVDVDVALSGRDAANSWFGATLGVEAGGPLIGGGAGAGIAAVAGGDASGGAIVGALVGLVPSIVMLFVAPMMTHFGTIEGTISLRRPSDGQALFTRHVRTDWTVDTNMFGVESRTAVASGRSAIDFERAVVATLREALADLAPRPAPERAAVPTPPAANSSGRATTREE